MAQAPKVTLVKNIVPAIKKALDELSSHRLVIGVPDNKAGRKDGQISNASLAYIHENGAPEVNIPPRPFLRPTIRENRRFIEEKLKKAAEDALNRGISPMRAFNALGLALASRARAKITQGIPPPLAESTVRGRIYRRKSKKYRREKFDKVAKNTGKGLAPGAGLFTPLIDTGQLRNAITYVIKTVSFKKRR